MRGLRCFTSTVLAWLTGLLAQDECFVTVFGFLPEAQAAVMREFARCGEILSFGSGREDKVNWVHIQFAVCPSHASPVLLTTQAGAHAFGYPK